MTQPIHPMRSDMRLRCGLTVRTSKVQINAARGPPEQRAPQRARWGRAGRCVVWCGAGRPPPRPLALARV